MAQNIIILSCVVLNNDEIPEPDTLEYVTLTAKRSSFLSKASAENVRWHISYRRGVDVFGERLGFPDTGETYDHYFIEVSTTINWDLFLRNFVERELKQMPHRIIMASVDHYIEFYFDSSGNLCRKPLLIM